MAIQKLTAATEIKSGQWALETPMLRDALCGRPRLIVKASGARVYLTNRHGEDEGSFSMRKSILYVCDTREEAEAVQAVSEAHYEAIKASTKSIAADSAAKIAALIAGTAA